MEPAAERPDAAPSADMRRPTVTMAVVMRKVPLANRWQPWKWELEAVLPDLGAFGTQPQCLQDDEQGARWLFPGYEVTLYRDEAEGYFLNLTSAAPCWFVLWRIAEAEGEGGDRPRPMRVSLSYNEAGRWLDAGETVENVPLSDEQLAWLRAYVAEHYRPEPKKRRRPESFKSPQERARY
ncbi:uncharacterized protein DUF3305 [Cupriavidus gilardii J11]|uniref:Uncharacterized protein DUF3305 n=1 Tax=Cupriavidus gilardii J11 TaxID=936133 RepID=A0A562BME9_9BURK|nr:DUF3305 domain-containing protein [Cupriavidus gilardii]TWG86465.1 uncharacterized protein DUF3305 [Cupriavidus gilardii J11]